MPSRPVLIGRGLVPHPPCTPKTRVYTRANCAKEPSTVRVHYPTPNNRVEPTTTCCDTRPPTTAHTHQQGGPRLGPSVTAAIATGKHPDPSRTRKLSLPAPMVLPPRGGGRVGRRRTFLPKGPPAMVALSSFPGAQRCPHCVHRWPPRTPSPHGPLERGEMVGGRPQR